LAATSAVYCAADINTSVTKSGVIAGSIQFERSVQSETKRLLRLCAPGNPERAMSEVEYDRLLEAVRMAIEPAPQEDFVVHKPTLDEAPKAANDNQLTWPLVPFPDGWYAAC
jgi:hypothetical protein